MSDLIKREDAITAVAVAVLDDRDVLEAIKAIPSADADQTMTEKVREALMRLTMCAREECEICKYKDECGFDFQYNISTENMHTILEALSADAPKDIVFCYLCKWSESDHSNEDGYYCHHDTHNPKWKVFSHNFCSWGELAEEYKGYKSAVAVQGEWVIRENGNKECSLCGKERQDGWDYFCGYCGAKMKGGAE